MGVLELAFHFPTLPAILNIITIWLVLVGKAQGRSTDDCDWIGSGLRQEEDSRGIQPVYLRCSQGQVLWHYPRGALRVVLHLGNSQKDFRGCIRISQNSGGARIYLEGRKKLHLLYSKEDGKPDALLRCFSSQGGQAALYVEAEPMKNILKKQLAKFTYHIQRSSKKPLENDLEDCRPCEEEELLQLFCTSDFVIQGTVSSLYHNHPLLRSELTIRTTNVLRDSEPSVFEKKSAFFNLNEKSVTKYATLHRHLKCGTKAGSGEFVFMGNWILGNPVVNCVPRLGEWKRVRRKAIMEGRNECHLD